MAGATLLISSKNYSSWSLRGYLLARLAGLNFEEQIVDRLRHSLALQYIREPSVSVAQIVWLLGYEGPTSFNHAFARWTGRSASEARRGSQSSGDGKVPKLGCST